MNVFNSGGVVAMSYSLTDLQTIVLPAARDELLPRFARVERRHKLDGSVLTDADLAMQERVAGQLQQQFPGTDFLGEEMTAAEQMQLLQSDKPVWCLDPLDGTSNFAAGIPYFCVSLALLQQGEVVLGLVYDPVRDECFSADAANGALLNGSPLATVASGLSLKRATALISNGWSRSWPGDWCRIFRMLHSAVLGRWRWTGAGWRQVAVMSICMVVRIFGITQPAIIFSLQPVAAPRPLRVNRCLAMSWCRVHR